MPAVSLARVPTIAAIVVVAGLATATLTLAANSTLSSPTPPAVAPPAAAPRALVVPDVRKQAYVFAKGSLEQEGFAWRVEGAVPGFAANVVVSQSPAPGANVVLDGAPIVVLRLSRNGAYPQQGVPENVSPYPGKPARLVGSRRSRSRSRRPSPHAPSRPRRSRRRSPRRPGRARPRPRKPAFAVPGAPAEPVDEIALSVRAKRLAAWVEAHPTAYDRGGQPLALPAQLDRHRGALRLVGRRRRRCKPSSRSTRASRSSGASAPAARRVARQALAEVKEKSR